jgi:hypothetical protein
MDGKTKQQSYYYALISPVAPSHQQHRAALTLILHMSDGWADDNGQKKRIFHS